MTHPAQPTEAARFTGNWPAMVTPMYDDGRIRPESVPALVEKFLSEGAGGIYLCGSTGQGPLLTVEERKAIAEATLSAAAGRIQVMVHVGALRIEDCLDLARHAADHGAAAISSVVPMYYPPTVPGTMEHYRRIGSATSLPFYAYNFALPNCSVEEYVRQLEQVPNARGLKFTNLNMYDLAMMRVLSQGRLNVLSGADESYLSAKVQGADGAIGSSQNCAMRLFEAVRLAAEGGQFEESRRLMLLAAEFVHYVTIGGGLATLHAILTREGIPCGKPRHPILPADSAKVQSAWDHYRRVYAAAGLGDA